MPRANYVKRNNRAFQGRRTGAGNEQKLREHAPLYGRVTKPDPLSLSFRAIPLVIGLGLTIVATVYTVWLRRPSPRER